MTPDLRTSLQARRALPVLLALAAAWLGGCEPAREAPETVSAAPTRSFEVRAPRLDRDGSIRVTFSRDLDPTSIGRGSVRLFHGKRSVAFDVRPDGTDLVIVPHPGRREARRGAWRLIVEGAPSPRAVRATDGTPLARRGDWRVGAARAERLDLTPPLLLETVPANGARDVAPGAAIELRFSEPLDRSVVRSGRALRLFVDGAPVASRQRLVDGRRVVQVRPVEPVPRGAAIRVVAAGDILDVAGNALEGPLDLQFSTWDLELRELAETFQSDEMQDLRATSCAWADLRTPGYLMWATGRRVLGPLSSEPGVAPLVERQRVRFQVLLRPEDGELSSSFASGLRLAFLERDVEAAVLSATIDAGPTDLLRLGPTFEANRATAALLPVGGVDEASPVDVRPGRHGFGEAEVAFELPLPIPAGEGVLLDVTLVLAPGVHLLALPDPSRDALLDGGQRQRVRPLAHLLVTGGVPQARSLWYDSGAEHPTWRRASVAGAFRPDGVRATVEFQTAPADAAGRADEDAASPWSTDLDGLPSLRFVRFRVRFEGFPHDGRLPRIDRIGMPFEAR